MYMHIHKCTHTHAYTRKTKRGVALTGCNTTGPPCSVGRTTTRTPDSRPVCPPAVSQTTMTDDADRRQRAKQYWPIRQASNNVIVKRRNLVMSNSLQRFWNKTMEYHPSLMPKQNFIVDTITLSVSQRSSHDIYYVLLTFNSRSSGWACHYPLSSSSSTCSAREPLGNTGIWMVTGWCSSGHPTISVKALKDHKALTLTWGLTSSSLYPSLHSWRKGTYSLYADSPTTISVGSPGKDSK